MKRAGFLKRPDCSIYFESYGTGPAMVFAHGLGGIGVHGHAAGPCEAGHVGDRLDHARLVVRQHDRHERGPLGDRRLQASEVDGAVRPHTHHDRAAPWFDRVRR